MTKTNAINQIQEIKTCSLNPEQKELAIKIIERADEKDVNQLYQFIASRIKLGFNFDFVPEKNTQTVSLLKEIPEKNINIKLTDCDANRLIIGENFDALKNLKLLKSKIDKNFQVIYIDPPYNTEASLSDGNHLSYQNIETSKKFIYRDKFSRNGWLNMMNERLRMSKDLLSEDGIIFVSIDDSEMAYLKVLMDEIFGEENFICNFVWKNSSGSNDLVHLQNVSEYVICFAKNIKLVKISKKNLGIKKNMKNKFTSDNDSIPKTEFYSNLIMNRENGLSLVQNLFATKELKLLFNNKIFDHPKPTALIKFLINLHPNKNANILDFFAGSGTTGHAVLDLNNHDGGQRTFTLITNNENNIAHQITYERLFRLIQGEGTKGESFPWLIKNKPYHNQKLKVFEIEYFDTSQKNFNYKILKKITTLLQQNNLDYDFNELKANQKELFYELNALQSFKKLEGK